MDSDDSDSDERKKDDIEGNQAIDSFLATFASSYTAIPTTSNSSNPPEETLDDILKQMHQDEKNEKRKETQHHFGGDDDDDGEDSREGMRQNGCEVGGDDSQHTREHKVLTLPPLDIEQDDVYLRSVGALPILDAVHDPNHPLPIIKCAEVNNQIQNDIFAALCFHTVDVVASAPMASGKTFAAVNGICRFLKAQGVNQGPHVVVLVPSDKHAQKLLSVLREHLLREVPSTTILEALGSKERKAVFESVLSYKKDHRGALHDIIVATPGRLIDLLHSKVVKLFPTCRIALIENAEDFGGRNASEFVDHVSSVVGQMRKDRVLVCLGRTNTFGHMLRKMLRPSTLFVTPRKSEEDVTFYATQNDKMGAFLRILRESKMKYSTHCVFVGSTETAQTLKSKIQQELQIQSWCVSNDKESTDLCSTFLTFQQHPVLIVTDGVYHPPLSDVAISFSLWKKGGDRALRGYCCQQVHHVLVAVEEEHFRAVAKLGKEAISAGRTVPQEVLFCFQKDDEAQAQEKIELEAKEKYDKLYNSGQIDKKGIGFGKVADPEKEVKEFLKVTTVQVELPQAPKTTQVVNPFGHRLFKQTPSNPSPQAIPSAQPPQQHTQSSSASITTVPPFRPTGPPPRRFLEERSSSSSSSDSSRRSKRSKKDKKHSKHKKRRSSKKRSRS
eukprot:PhF_6_TR31737/c0_g1_i2/m.46714